MDSHDRIPFERCQIKLRLIDKELRNLEIARIKFWDEETEVFVEQKVHDSHQYAAFTHILSLIQEADSLAHGIWNSQQHAETMNDIHIRRSALYIIMAKKVQSEVGEPLIQIEE
jgi:hypothetical protein